MPIKFPQEVFPRLSNRVIAFFRRHAIIHGHINRVVVKKSRRVSFFFLHLDLAPPLSSLFSLSLSLSFFYSFFLFKVVHRRRMRCTRYRIYAYCVIHQQKFSAMVCVQRVPSGVGVLYGDGTPARGEMYPI